MDSIPTELGALMLENVPDMGSLWAVIRASPHIYHIFSENRDKILPIIITRDIGPILMADALAALHSSRFTSHQNVEGENTEISIRGLSKSETLEWVERYLFNSNALQWVEHYLFGSEKLEWIEDYNKGRDNRRNILPPSKDMLPLWQLHQDVTSIADLYVRETLHIFNRRARDRLPPERKSSFQTLGDLSLIESQRIFRAIYRFLIFGNLFGSSPSIWEENELCEYFLCRFTAWQVEEIRCIHDFVTDRILQKWQEMENDEFHCLVTDPKLWDIEPRPDPWNCRWSADFFSKTSKMLYFKDKQKLFARLPIKDLRALFQAKGGALQELVRKWASVYQDARGPFLEEVLRVCPAFSPVNPGGEMLRDDAEIEPSRTYFPKYSEVDDVMSCNTGWYWAEQWYPRELYVSPTSDSCSSYCAPEGNEGFRRFGYVFWDSPHWYFLVGGGVEQRGFGEETLAQFPRPAFEDQSLSVEERIRELAGCDCGEVVWPEDSKCKIKGHGLDSERK